MTTRRENFPVGSLLIRPDLRRAVHAFYRVARAADDIADDPARPEAHKLAALQRIEDGLDGRPGAPEALALREELLARGRPAALAQARALLGAFRFDARGGRIGSWADLLGYCEDSANPVGRFLLELHGEEAGAVPAADALCTALQILNHLQDIGDDHRSLGRRYLPGDWMAEEGAAEADLGRARMSLALARVVARALDRTEGLLDRAAPLPDRLASRRLAAESATILALGRRLARRLRAGDPLAARIAPSRADFAWAGLRGLVRAARTPAPAGEARRA